MSYKLTGLKSGTVTFVPSTGTITQEVLTKSSKMTSNAIEYGSSIEDHVYLNPEQLQITGVVVKNHNSFKDQLEAMHKNRDLVTYTGKIRVSNYVIINLQIKNSSSNKKGFQFTATLQKANIVSGQYVEMGQTALMSQQDSGSKTGAQTAAQSTTVKAAGLKTTVSQQISQSSYTAYINSYSGKSSSGPTQRTATSYNGV
ncbi:MAG: phage baseplate protein [Lacrimispora sphenoides]